MAQFSAHLSAAELWGIRRPVHRPSDAGGRGEHPDAHVTVPKTSGLRKRAGIVLHRSSTLIARHCTRRDAIPVTTPARTLTDLHPLLSPAHFSAALREAEFLRLPVDQRRRADGSRAGNAQPLPPPPPSSASGERSAGPLQGGLSLAYRAACRRGGRLGGAPKPFRVRTGPGPGCPLAVLGFHVLRFTWRQLTRDPKGVADTIRRLLGARAA